MPEGAFPARTITRTGSDPEFRAREALLPRIVLQRFPVGRQDLKMVKPGVHSRVTPDNFLLTSDLEQLHLLSLGVVTGDDRVPHWAVFVHHRRHQRDVLPGPHW